MKIQGAKKIHYDSGPNMTPLVDVVMVILIFFMMAGSFLTAEKYLVSDIPVEIKGAGGKPAEGSPIPTKIYIKVTQDGLYYTAAADKFAVVHSAADPKLAYQTLYSELSKQRKNYLGAGIDPDKMEVLIYPTSEVTLNNLVVVYQAALEAGFTKVGFGVRSE